MNRILAGMTLVLCLGGCGALTPRPAPPARGEVVPFFQGLGPVGRPIRTSSPQAQRYFDQGLAFLFAFNHDEALRSFRRAAEIDPSASMAWWGMAVANGPHINNPVVPPDRSRSALSALAQARGGLDSAAPVERALLEAQERRFADPTPQDRRALDEAYADAMREVWKRFPDDADVGALFAESLMDLRPWDLWSPDGRPQPGTDEVVATLEAVLALAPQHPLGLHLYIHAWEASPHPEKAAAAADRLRGLQPGLGHMLHMPAHIDVRTGRWEAAIAANEAAVEADRRYRDLSPEQDFYRMYMAHNHQLLAWAAMMCGRRARATRAVDEMVAEMPREWVKSSAAIADGLVAMPLEVRLRFGLWDEVLAAPEPPEYLPIARALRHQARGIALAARDDFAGAEVERREFAAARARVPADAFFFNNPASALLELAEHMLAGEVQYRQGQVEAGLAALRRAVEAEDRLRYDEPPDWILPARHALGAALLRSHRAREAEAVFREDLRRLPENGWGLYGLAEALGQQGRKREAERARNRFRDVWAGSDTPISSPCFCQAGR